MRFLTEDDIRARCPQAGGVLSLGEHERLTPSAREYVAGLHLRLETRQAQAGPAQAGEQVAGQDPCAYGQDMTCLDKSTLVSKAHPAIILRGKLDSLLAEIVLLQTRFDPGGQRPAFLKQCLEDLRLWVLRALTAEVTGNRLPAGQMGGMDMEILHEVSRAPLKYLGLDHYTAEAALGCDIAQLNRLRALVRETEVMAVACSGYPEVICALNRMSSAVYVLMLLTLGAEKGLPATMPPGKPGTD